MVPIGCLAEAASFEEEAKGEEDYGGPILRSGRTTRESEIIPEEPDLAGMYLHNKISEHDDAEYEGGTFFAMRYIQPRHPEGLVTRSHRSTVSSSNSCSIPSRQISGNMAAAVSQERHSCGSNKSSSAQEYDFSRPSSARRSVLLPFLKGTRSFFHKK